MKDYLLSEYIAYCKEVIDCKKCQQINKELFDFCYHIRQNRGPHTFKGEIEKRDSIDIPYKEVGGGWVAIHYRNQFGKLVSSSFDNEDDADKFLAMLTKQ